MRRLYHGRARVLVTSRSPQLTATWLLSAAREVAAPRRTTPFARWHACKSILTRAIQIGGYLKPVNEALVERGSSGVDMSLDGVLQETLNSKNISDKGLCAGLRHRHRFR
jgi:hypothetical protein